MTVSKLSEPVRFLRDLIALPSVNPAFLPVGHAWAGETRVGEWVAEQGRRAGLAVAWQAALPGRKNLRLRLSPRGRVRRRILLAPHLDTVGSLDGSDEIFKPRISGGRVWGRGACDTKGSVAAMLWALLEVVREPARPRETEIELAGLIDEETCQHGSRAWVAAGGKADLAIVGEPTRLSVVTAHKGDVWARLTVRGRAAHGACPERGENAIRTMSKVVQLLEGEYAAGLRERRHALLGHPTINVGTIRGGAQPNIVPDQCSIEVDRRTLPGETESGVRREIVGFLRGHGVRVEFEEVKGVPELAMETDPEMPLVRSFLGLAGQKEPIGVHYFCDASVLSAGGTPSVVFGPGDIAQAHTAREWIAIRSLERAGGMLKRFLLGQP